MLRMFANGVISGNNDETGIYFNMDTNSCTRVEEGSPWLVMWYAYSPI